MFSPGWLVRSSLPPGDRGRWWRRSRCPRFWSSQLPPFGPASAARRRETTSEAWWHKERTQLHNIYLKNYLKDLLGIIVPFEQLRQYHTKTSWTLIMLSITLTSSGVSFHNIFALRAASAHPADCPRIACPARAGTWWPAEMYIIVYSNI